MLVVTGSRAEFGLLRPVMHAIRRQSGLELLVVASGSHLIAPADTFREVKASFAVAEAVPMQIAGRTGRVEDAEAVARGIGRFARVFERLSPDWVVVLGDRIEAFAAASAASIGGWALSHIHGGDRAEGVADEAMRHAITKLAHLHFAASDQSARRIVAMGEQPENVLCVGSPAMDELAHIEPLSHDAAAELCPPAGPTVVFLMHPIGRPVELEEAAASAVLDGLRAERVLALSPNFDPGREGIEKAIARAGVAQRPHLPRTQFVGVLKRIAALGGPGAGVLVGNSSAGLIEAAALGVPVVDIGNRQAGRERAGKVVHLEHESPEGVARAVAEARAMPRGPVPHPFGDGRAGERIAAALAARNPHEQGLVRKRCTY